MRSCQVHLASLASVILVFCLRVSAKVNPDDLAAWQAFYDSTNGAEWPDCSQLRNKPCLCGTDEPIVARNIEPYWTYAVHTFIGGVGVQCLEIEYEGQVMVEERIVGISMPGWNLTGTLPESFNQLTELTHLNLGNNNLHGKVNPVCGIPTMKHLALYGNRFEGNVPACIGYFEHLRSLNMAGNLFRGKLPKSLGKLGVLRELVLAEQNTYREDELPEDPKKRSKCRELKRVPGYDWVKLYRADRTWTCGGLSGTLPKEMAKMKWLRVLNLAGNSFYDVLPEWMPVSMESLDLSDNHFKTPWPKRWGPECRRMMELRLSYNDLQLSWSEILPTFRHWMDNIRDISLSGTGLSGHMPDVRYRIPELNILRLADNDLIGEISAINGLHVFDVRNNTKLYGDINTEMLPMCAVHVRSGGADTGPFEAGCFFSGTQLQIGNIETRELDPEQYENVREAWELMAEMQEV